MLSRWHICTTLRTTLRDCRLIVCHHLRFSRMLNCRSESPQDSHDPPRQLFLIGLLTTFEIPLQSGRLFIANSVFQSVRKTACGFLQIDVVTPKRFLRVSAARSACATNAVIAITGTLPSASGPRARISRSKFEAVHSGHFNIGQHQVRMTIFYSVERRIPRQHDVYTQLLQEETQIPSYVVMIFHNDNRKIAEPVGRHVADKG